MKIIDYFKNIINKLKHKNKLLLNSPYGIYEKLIDSSKINKIINNMPKDLSDLEKAYYIYLELGKIVSENPNFVFTDLEGKTEHYNDKIDEQYFGICKSISELYVAILKDKRIGIDADLVKQHNNSPISHVDTILKINGKNYITNLISDLSRIKTSRRVNSFGIDLNRRESDLKVKKEKGNYLKKLNNYYGNISYLNREDIEQLDKKLGYSFFIPQLTKGDQRGLYTEDTIELLKNEFNNSNIFKEYVLHNQDVTENDILKYKLNYIFDNIEKFADYNGQLEYLENIRWYISIAKKVLSPKEASRIHAYVATIGNDKSNLISILKIKPSDNSEKNNLYYLYSKKEKKYINKTPEEMKKFIDSFEKDSLNIIGTFDRFNPRNIDELEL